LRASNRPQQLAQGHANGFRDLIYTAPDAITTVSLVPPTIPTDRRAPGRDFELRSTGSVRGDHAAVDFLIRTQQHAYSR
jgi:hypothetical protein